MLTGPEILAHHKSAVEHIGEGLEPQEDWCSMLFLINESAPDGEPREIITGLPQLGDPQLKPQFLSTIIPTLIAQHKPEWAVLTNMAWYKRYDQSLEGAAEQARDEARFAPGNIADRDGKKEIVCVMALSKTGEAHLAIAEVTRYPNLSPKLSWLDELNESKCEGAFADAIREGFKQAGAA